MQHTKLRTDEGQLIPAFVLAEGEQPVGFMIRNQEGLFSSGGLSPEFGPTGKIWGSMPNVKRHLALLKNNTHWVQQPDTQWIREPYDFTGWEVVPVYHTTGSPETVTSLLS